MSLLTSAPLHLTYAGGLYDRTAPLATGEIRPEGIDLNYVPVVPPEAFWRHLKEQDLLERDFALEEAFAPSTLETFRQ